MTENQQKQILICNLQQGKFKSLMEEQMKQKQQFE